jgi:ABC-2 type transport system ATP-binding protein
MSRWAIETQNLTKRFGRQTVVDDLSLRIPVGSIVGLLGPNGAGKTTFIRMLMGHLHPTAGSITTLNGNPWQHRPTTLQRIGYVSQAMGLPAWMTAGQAIAMNERLFPKWDRKLAAELLDEFALRGTGTYRKLSGGQQRKIMILLALAQSPDLLILDEPAAGLDVEARNTFLQRILDIACGEGRTVLLSSHLVGDLERMVDRVVLIRSGRLIMEGELDALKTGIRQLQILADVPEPVLREHFDVLSLSQPALNETLATVSNFSDERAARFVSTLRGPELMRVHNFNLEQLYLELK